MFLSHAYTPTPQQPIQRSQFLNCSTACTGPSTAPLPSSRNNLNFENKRASGLKRNIPLLVQIQTFRWLSSYIEYTRSYLMLCSFLYSLRIILKGLFPSAYSAINPFPYHQRRPLACRREPSIS